MNNRPTDPPLDIPLATKILEDLGLTHEQADGIANMAAILQRNGF